MNEAELVKMGGIFLLSTVKLLFAPGTSVASGLSLGQTILVTSAGGITGILFFYYLGQWLMARLGAYSERLRILRKQPAQQKKLFNRKNRFIITIKRRYGLIGLALLTPCIISIPIGAVVAARFYHHDRLTVPLLIISVILWSVGLSIFSITLKTQILTL